MRWIKKVLIKVSGLMIVATGIFLMWSSLLGLLAINAEPIDYGTLFALLGIGATGFMLFFIGGVLLVGDDGDEGKEHQGQE